MRRSQASREAEDARMRIKFASATKARKPVPVEIRPLPEQIHVQPQVVVEAEPPKPEPVIQPDALVSRKSIWTIEYEEFREQTFSFPHLRQGRVK